MSHATQRAFFADVKARFRWAFVSVRALDCGALDVNGSMRDMFRKSEYIGVDLRAGKNVDIVAKVHELPFRDASFDTVLSAEMLEHDEFWRLSLAKMYSLLRVGGLLAISAASLERAEHGTTDAPDGGEIWGTSPEYYRGFSAADLWTVFNINSAFHAYGVEQVPGDIYFWGIKA